MPKDDFYVQIFFDNNAQINLLQEAFVFQSKLFYVLFILLLEYKNIFYAY